MRFLVSVIVIFQWNALLSMYSIPKITITLRGKHHESSYFTHLETRQKSLRKRFDVNHERIEKAKQRLWVASNNTNNTVSRYGLCSSLGYCVGRECMGADPSYEDSGCYNNCRSHIKKALTQEKTMHEELIELLQQRQQIRSRLISLLKNAGTAECEVLDESDPEK